MHEVPFDRLPTPLPISEREVIDPLADPDTDVRLWEFLKARQANEKGAFCRHRLKSWNGRFWTAGIGTE